MISKDFRFSFFLTKKIKSKGRKFIDCTGPIRGANPSADAITLRCNHSTSYVKGRSRAASGPRQGAKNMPKCSEKVSPSKYFDVGDSPKSSFFHQKCSMFCIMQNCCLATYNFFVSQRPALILSGNQIQTY